MGNKKWLNYETWMHNKTWMNNEQWTTLNHLKGFQNNIDKHLGRQAITIIGNEVINNLNRRIVNAIKQAEQTKIENRAIKPKP